MLLIQIGVTFFLVLGSDDPELWLWVSCMWDPGQVWSVPSALRHGEG